MSGMSPWRVLASKQKKLREKCNTNILICQLFSEKQVQKPVFIRFLNILMLHA